MKKITCFAMLLIIAANSFSQQPNPASLSTNDYLLKKSKHQKTAAWAFLSGGFVCAVIGTAIVLNDLTYGTVDVLVTGENTNTSNTGAVITIIGIVSMAASIPLFIAAHRNKKNAMILSFKNETAPQIQKSNLVYRSVPSLTLKISL